MTRYTHPICLTSALLALGILCETSAAQAQMVLPKGGSIASGSVLIGTYKNKVLAISQTSQTAIVNWRDFSIGLGALVFIDQPNAQAVMLNRVTGSTSSIISGELNARGQVYLVNPNGITITAPGKVNAGGGFVASTLDISDDDFSAGKRTFRGPSNPTNVANSGAITIGSGGYAALIGGQVSNDGTITVPLGKVGLGTGSVATLDISGDGFLQVTAANVYRQMLPLVTNGGRISADGGSVILAAAQVRGTARLTVNLSGVIEARTVSGRKGDIRLLAGCDLMTGRCGTNNSVWMANTARIDATGTGGEDGGRAVIMGNSAYIDGTIDASGASRGNVFVHTTNLLSVKGRVQAKGSYGSIFLLGGHGDVQIDPSAQIELSATGHGYVESQGKSRIFFGP